MKPSNRSIRLGANSCRMYFLKDEGYFHKEPLIKGSFIALLKENVFF